MKTSARIARSPTLIELIASVAIALSRSTTLRSTARFAGVWAALLALPLGNASALAAPILDQDNSTSTNGLNGYAVVPGQQVAQTFTVGITGLLTTIDLQLYDSPGAVGDPIFEIRRTSSGVPDNDNAAALFRSVIPLSSIPDGPLTPPAPFVTIDASASNIQVTAGDVLALSLRRTTGSAGPPWVIWLFGGIYDGGAEFVRGGDSSSWTSPNPIDAAFRTFVPEPATLALLGVGLAGLAASRQSHKGIVRLSCKKVRAGKFRQTFRCREEIH